MRKACYISCNCSACRAASSKRKGEVKVETHRRFRRVEKTAIRNGDEGIQCVSSNYRS